MRRILSPVAAILFALPTAAQTVGIQSGEHADFSRLVLDVARTTDWQFGRVPGGYELRLARTDVRFDLSEIFDYIPRDRIASVAAPPHTGVLRLLTDCECHADVFDVRGRWLAIDIKAGAAPLTAEFEARLEPRGSDGRDAYPGTPGAAPGLGREALSFPRTAGPQASPRDPGSGPSRMQRTRQVPVDDRAPLAPAPTTRLPNVEAALVDEIGRAAAQGLLELDVPSFIERTPDEDPASRGTGAPAQLDQEDAPSDVPTVPLRARTSIDREAFPLHPAARTGGDCLPDAAVAVGEWGDAQPPYRQISARRAALFRDADAAEPKAAADLARLYLYLGFGAEADAVLDAFGSGIENEAILRAMSDIMSRGSSDRPGRLASQLTCGTDAALWGALARESLPQGGDVAVGAVRRAFSELPPHLRRYLGPILVARFTEAEDPETAAAIREATARAPGVEDSDLAVGDAALARADGRLGEADERLSVVAAGDPDAPAAALVAYVETRIENGGEVDASTLENIEARVFEQRNTPEGTALRRASILASLAADDFEAAFAKRARLNEDGLGAARLAALDAGLFEGLARRASETKFLEETIGSEDRVAKLPGKGAATAAAGRYLELGFPERALQLLAKPPMDASPEERRLRARAKLALGKPEDALRAIAGMGGKAAERLRADAAAQLGEHDAAAGHYAATEATELQAAEAWQAGDWRTVAEIGNPSQKTAARLFLSNGSGPPESDGATGEQTLSQMRNSLDRSTAVREALAELIGPERGEGLAN